MLLISDNFIQQKLNIVNNQKVNRQLYYFAAILINFLSVLVLLISLSVFSVSGQAYSYTSITVLFDVSFIAGSLILSAVPLFPMGIGITQLALAEIYSNFLLNPHAAIDTISVSQLAQIWLAVLIGGIFLLKNNINKIKK